MAELNQYLNKAFDYEEKGFVEEAIHLCNKCMCAFPEYGSEIEFEIAKMYYRNGKEEEALNQFLGLYQETGTKAVRDLILEAYYGVRQQEFEERYQENHRKLRDYPHFFGNKEAAEIRYYPIWAGEDLIWYYDSVDKVFCNERRSRLSIKESKDCVCLGSNLLWMEDILVLEKMTRKMNPCLDMENALLLVYQKETWDLLLQILDLNELLELDRIVLYDDGKQLEASFLEEGVAFPFTVIGNVPSEVSEILAETYKKGEQQSIKYWEEAVKYYEENGNMIIHQIKKGKPKILFWTTRFSTAIQYHTRDAMAIAEKMGLKVELIIEKDRLSTLGSELFTLKKIAQFKPDIIVQIDHFRHEHKGLDGINNIVWICWAMDGMEQIMNPKTPQRLTDRDFVMNHFITWNKFKEIGYGEECLIDAPVPSNPDIYKIYELSGEEKEKYSCDICFVCHASDVEGHIQSIVQNSPEAIKDKIYSVYKGYENYVYEMGEMFYSEEIFAVFISNAMKQHYNIVLSPKFLEYLAKDMCMWFNQRVFRQALVKWILDAGFTNIKLWGNGWGTNEEYKKYAMGPAENGEVLSKIYQASKIVIGNNCVTTAAARAWETMLSGGFYMSNYIPEEDDEADIRKIIEVGKDVIMFYNRDDLIEKLHYYLEHEDERQEMIKRGRKVALEKMTFDVLMKKVLKEVAERLEENTSER